MMLPTIAARSSGWEVLMRLVADVEGILFSEALATEDAVVLAKACELGFEASRRFARAASIGAGRAAIG